MHHMSAVCVILARGAYLEDRMSPLTLLRALKAIGFEIQTHLTTLSGITDELWRRADLCDDLTDDIEGLYRAFRTVRKEHTRATELISERSFRPVGSTSVPENMLPFVEAFTILEQAIEESVLKGDRAPFDAALKKMPPQPTTALEG